MNEDQMHKFLMLAGMVLTILAGLGCVGLLIACALSFSGAMMWSAVLLAAAAVGLGYATTYFGQKVTGHPLIFTNEAEREVLTRKQRQHLRKARAEVVLDRALVEVEHERQNIVHRQIEASNDPDKPPYKTRWTGDSQRKLGGGEHT
jgi:Spy/CpxP family protein refolding chaperone